LSENSGRASTAVGEVQTVQHATLSWLRTQIASGRFEPGARLGQDALARDAGVSIPPVREALQTLEAEGHVIYHPRRGYFLADLNLAEFEEVYRIRDLLESEAVGRAVDRFTRDDMKTLRTAMKTMERAHQDGDIVTLTDMNRAFHFTIFDAAGMPRMGQMIRILWDSTDRYRSFYYASPQHRRRVNTEHRAIAAAVGRGESDLAIRLSREHREHALEALRLALSEQAQTTGAVHLHT
jgi:DNA-binding GntR family transcriptional regulator